MKKIILILILGILFNYAKSQTIVNREWVQLAGIPDPLSIVTNSIDFQNNIITASSSIVSGQDANITVIKYDIDGNILWQNSFNGVSNGKDYSTSVKTDAIGNVFVIGTTFNTTTNYDFILIKYNASGVLQWQQIYNGPGNNIDIPTAIAFDNVNNIYITGASTGLNSLTDFATIKYSSAGVQQWVSTYDFALGYEAPVGIDINPITNQIYITGASASTQASNNWDYATVEYNTLGAQINVNRVTSAGNGLDKPTAIARDNSGNIYVTGSSFNSANNSNDIKTIKLNSNLILQWEMTFNGDNLEDQANSIDVDPSGNVFIAGYVSRTNSGQNIIVLKYSPTGTLLWQSEINEPGSFADESGNSIIVDANGNAFVTGSYDENGNKNFISMKIAPDGTINWQDIFDGGGSGSDEASSININSNGDIIVSGTTNNGTNNANTTIRYKTITLNSNNIGTVGNFNFIREEVLIGFSPSIINSNFSENIDLKFARINEVLPQSTIDKIGLATGIENPQDLILVKIFDWLIPSDSISIARNGDLVVLPKLWSNFKLLLPSNYDEITISTQINSINNEILFCDLNYLLESQSIPNDPNVLLQHSLISSANFPNADINCNAGWDIEVGSPSIRVGIVDDFIDYRHPDFGNGTFIGSKIVDGEDCTAGVTGIPISSVTVFAKNHGTETAGIVGAIRNNSIGISGIAGGDALLGNTGVSLVSLGTPSQSVADVSKAMVKGASYTYLGSQGYFCNVLNVSQSIAGVNGGLPHPSLAILESAVRTCALNHCVLVTSRGNRTTGDPSTVVWNMYPACYQNEWVLNIGGSGNDGGHKYHNTNGDSYYESMYGSFVDVIAPGSEDIVLTTKTSSLPQLLSSSPPFVDPDYTPFSGTSSAAPHVTGLVALMQSHHLYGIGNYPNDLDDGDIQHLIKKYANDINSEGIVKVGSGLINVGSTLEHCDLNHGYWIQHANSSLGGTNTYTETVLSSNQNFSVPYNMWEIASGIYNGDLIEHKYEYTFQLPPWCSANTQIVDAWIKHPYYGVSALNPLNKDLFANLTYTLSGNVINATVKTYTWIAKYGINSVAVFKNIPSYSNPSNTSTNFSCMPSFQFYDPALVTSSENLTLENLPISIYPNPASDIVNINFESVSMDKFSVKFINILGVCVIDKTFDISKGINRFQVLVNELPNGIYNVIIASSQSKVSSKLIINHQ